ncbi:response regulator [Teichococcus aestuarii]|uniref:histidine kinase n=2 Tax=Teichococcus aestuarii TaxID=568898 RepID=A0A2U1V3C9_9PROT|nr:response regulator [Pseudoroseomonas aestuarii]PWC28417.1 hybrid sensor histidine kinase/response regulator [Pseudoroseomonas aestuarii]
MHLDTPATLLLVDDEPEILVALADLFEDEFRVLTAPSGPHGLEILAAEPDVHVIISDQRMPEMTGDAFLGRARQVSQAEALLLTGYADLEAVINALNHGRIAGYAPKPWEPAALLSMVRNAAERFRLGRSLETEQALLQGLLESSADPLSFKDAQGRFVRLNAAKAAALARPLEACLHHEEAAMLDRPAAAAALRRADAEAMARRRPVEVVEQRQEAGAPPRWVRISRIPILGRDGQPTHLATVEHDMTEQRALEERLHQAEKMQALGTMAGGIAHDFNNLLTAILGSLELLLHSGMAQPRQERLVKNAILAAERGSTLTQRLLSFSRKRDLQLRASDVNRLVTDVEDLLLRSLGDAITLHRQLADALWPAMVDPEQFGLALLNLCINSRDAMPEGGSITLRTRNVSVGEEEVGDLAGGDYVAIAVSDTGSGMPPEVMAQAFEPFFTTKEVGKGTGLGLSMVYGLTRQSGGTTVITSVPGEGTTVELFLPRALRPAEAQASQDGVPQPAAHPVTVLVVDDDPAVRRVTATFLADLGHRVVEVPDGEAALRSLRDNPGIGLMVSDLVMPRMSGVELTRNARSLRPALPILLLTGYADPARVPEGYPVLRKPFRRADLAHCVAELLQG